MNRYNTKYVSENYKANYYKNGKFENEYTKYSPHISQVPSMIWDFIFNKSKTSQAKQNEIPVIKLTTKDIENLGDYSVIRFGHSTLLFKLEERLILTDPVFSNRASPFSFMGPKRFHNPPIHIEELPDIDIVIISHNHYDHLDKQSIKKLKNKVEKFYTTIGVGKILQKYGIDKEKIIELDWWESKEEESIELTATPAQHFSGRWIIDNNKTLWSSWVIKAQKANLYFGADGGYFEGFKEIAWNYGPFDMTFLEVGAYNKKWKDIHMLPEDGVQAHLDLKGKVMFPIHNGTFDLSLHSWKEPFQRVDEEAQKKDINIIYPKMGETISLIAKNTTTKWWKE